MNLKYLLFNILIKHKSTKIRGWALLKIVQGIGHA